MPRLLSVNVGLPRDIAWRGKTVRTAIWKTPVQGGRMVRRLNIDGDGQGDLAGHGGEHRAVFVYQIDSYHYWQSQLGRNDFTYGQFGENFTVDGLSDQEVCIGDRYRVGGALFEVTQPRVTCYRVGIRMEEPQMAALLVAHGRPGFYLRVLEEGEVEAGDEILRVASGPERMSVFEINALLYMPGHPRSQLERALRIPALSAGWRGSLEALFAQECSGGATTGNAGLTQASGPPPAWPGFRPLRVSRKVRESSSVISLVLEPADAPPSQCGSARPVRRGAAKAFPRCTRADAQLLAVGRAQCRALSRERQAGSPRRGRRLHRREAAGRRRGGRERGAGRIHASTRRRARRSAERGHRGDPRARNAPRVGGRGIAEGSLVDTWRPRPPRACFCR